MTPSEKLHHFVIKAQAGDRQAFRQVVELMMPRLYGVVYTMVNDQDEVNDILQDAFVRAYRALPKLRKPEAFAGWMTRIAVNTGRTRLSRRREYPTEPGAPLFQLQGTLDTTVEDLEQEDLQRVLYQALEQLSPEHREVVAMVELEEMNCAEAAKLLDCPAGTVRSRLHYARKKLKEILQPYKHWLLQEESQR